MKRFLFALVALVCAVAPASAIADVPSQLQPPSNHRPPIVSNLVASRSGEGKVTLTWTMSVADGFSVAFVSVSRTGGGPHRNTRLEAVQSWTDSSVVNGLTYRYGVCVHDSGGEVGCAFASYTPGANPNP